MGFWQQTVANMILHLFSSNQKIQRLIHIYGTVPHKELDKALEREMWDDGNVHTLSLLFECRADMLLLS